MDREPPSTLARIDGAAALWASLLEPSPPVPEPFDPGTLAELPGPARRFLAAAIPAGAPLADAVVLQMEGTIRLGGRWLPFTASQVLRRGVGFLWAPTVGGRIVRFVGADLLGPDGARMEFRLHGLVPVVRASGPDVVRSACGRLAAETVAWLPQALTPQRGATWRDIDDEHAIVAVAVPDGSVEVEVGVDENGRLVSQRSRRWNTAAKPPAEECFGGTFAGGFETSDGVRVADSGTVAWHPDRPGGEFFHYRLVGAGYPELSPE